LNYILYIYKINDLWFSVIFLVIHRCGQFAQKRDISATLAPQKRDISATKARH